MAFCYSTDGEGFHGRYETRDKAIEEAISHTEERDMFWIGETVAPTPPEQYWSAEDWLELVSQQDDYAGEWAEDWDCSTDKQQQELEDLVRPIMAAWLQRHKLLPTHYGVENMVKHQNLNGEAVCREKEQPQS